MATTTFIVLLALLQYLVFVGLTGAARARGGVAAPACTGDEAFERWFRVQQNTLEQLVVFVPAMFILGNLAAGHPLYTAIPGLAFLLGRALYARAYVRDPKTRGPGMLLTLLANAALVGGALVLAVVGWLRA